MFDEILRELIDVVPGARGAVFCDPEGETVTAVGASGRTDRASTNDYELRVAGAQFATPMYFAGLGADRSLGELRECTVAGPRENLLVCMLPQRYYVVLCMDPEALTGGSMQALRRFASRIALEM